MSNKNKQQNNKKKNDGSKDDAVVAAAAATVTATATTTTTKPKPKQRLYQPQQQQPPFVMPTIFTKNQFISLGIMGLGYVNITQLSKAIATTTIKGEENNNDNNNPYLLLDAADLCVEYLGSTDVCSNYYMNVLLRYKLHCVLQLFVTVLFFIIDTMNTDSIIQKLNFLLTLSPTSLGVMLLFYYQNIQVGLFPMSIFHAQAVLLLICTAFTFKTGINSFRDTNKSHPPNKISHKSISQSCLIYMMITLLYESSCILFDKSELHSYSSTIQLFDANANNQIPTTTMSESFQQYWYAAQPIITSLVIDKVTMFFVYGLALYYLNNIDQQKFLFKVAFLKWFEYQIGLKEFIKDILSVQVLYTLCFLSALFCSVASMVPFVVTMLRKYIIRSSSSSSGGSTTPTTTTTADVTTKSKTN